VTDREATIAVYKAVEKLYLAMTGQPLTVDVQTEDGIVRITDWEGQATLA